MPAYTSLYSHRSPYNILYVAKDHKSNTFIDYHDLHFTFHRSFKTAQWRFHFLSTPYRTKWTFSYPWPKDASFLSVLEELSVCYQCRAPVIMSLMLLNAVLPHTAGDVSCRINICGLICAKSLLPSFFNDSSHNNARNLTRTRLM